MATPRDSFRFGVLFILLVVAVGIQAQTALQFVAVTPCRVVDTRNAPGPFGGPSIGKGGERDFPIPQGSCNIPSTAAAYSLNVTVAPHGSLGYLTIWPRGQTRPLISTLNSDGRIKANAAIVPAGTNQAVSVYATDVTDVILDIDGYFVPANSSTLAFFPLTPCRVVDTRWAQGALGGPPLRGKVERDFPVLSSSCGIPSSAQAYSMNFTVVPPGAPMGYLAVWPTGETQPLVSTLNDANGTIVANAAIVPAGASDEISVYATDNTNLLIDIDGYFAPAGSAPGPLSLFALSPCRVLDTRHTIQAFTGMLPVGVLQSLCQVPSAQAYVLNATVVPPGSLSYLALWPDTENQPVVSTLNALDGAVTSNMAIVPTVNGSVDAYATNPTDLVLDIFSYFAPIGTLQILNTSLPSATLTYSYSTTLTASGGVTPYTWSISSGSLPPGLSLNASTGVISGTPTMTGNYPFTVKVTDSQSTPATASAALSITVTSTIRQLTITTTTLPSGTQNQNYNGPLTATGGVTPYTWSILSGAPPAGLSLNASTGMIGGTPSGGGTFNFTVQVKDSELPPVSETAQLSMTVVPAVALRVTSTTLPPGTAGNAYSATLFAVGGVYPYTWAITSGTLPNGLSMNSSGAITGTPILTGTWNFTVMVTDSEQPPVTATGPVSLTIHPNHTGAGALSGNYAFYLNGFNSSGAWTLAGSFVADGNGSITSGVVDYNSDGGQPVNVNITGDYVIESYGVNTLTIVGPSYGPATFAFNLASGGNGRIVEYDDTNGQGNRGSGELRKQDPSAFSLARLNGTYVYGVAGIDRSGLFIVNVGLFTLASGGISNGACDIDNGGVFGTCTFVGSMSSINAQTGRGQATIQGSNGAANQAVYVVSSSELILEQIDPFNQ